MSTQVFGFNELRQILVERAGLSEEDVVDDPDATFDEMGLDSLGLIEVQMAVREKYGLEVPEEDADRITTVGQAIEYVNQRLAAKA